MTKISALSDIGTSVASNDTFVLVDVSDPTTPNKKIQQQNLFLIPDGSAGTPGLRFLSDTNVGLFRPTTDTLAIVTGGSERLRIDSSGRLGLGTSSPATLFSTASSAASDGVQSAGSNSLNWVSSNSNAYIGAFQNQGLGNGILVKVGDSNSARKVIHALDGSNNSLFLVQGDGKVGIGTTAPSELLETSGGNISIYHPSTGNGAGYSLLFKSNGGSTGATLAQIVASQSGTNVNTANLRFLVANAGSLGEAARIDSSGRLLVGTSTAYQVESGFSQTSQQIVGGDPLALLRYQAGAGHVTSWFCKSRNATVGQHTVLQVNDGIARFNFQGSDGTNFVTAARIDAAVDGTPGANSMPGRLVFSTTADGASSPTERARITSSGKTVINSTDPVLSATFSVLSQTGVNTCALKSDASTSAAILNIWGNETSGDQIFSRFATDSNAPRGSITYNRGGGVVAYNTTSDYRSKTILGDLENAGATIDAFKVYRGVMNGATVERPMLIAHEAQEVAPYCVTGEKDAVDDDNNPIYQQMDHQVLVPLLIAEIQQLRARVAALEGV